jgi:hypothetical protein
MNPLTQFKKISIQPLLITLALVIGQPPAAHATDLTATPVLIWSTEVRRAIVPAGPGGIFGPENYGNKFPGEAGVYMGIVHVAMYDAAVAIEGGYEPYAIALTAPTNTSPEAAIATAAHHTLVGCADCSHSGLQPALGLTPDQQAILDSDYASYMDSIPEGEAKTDGIWVGQQVAAAVVALRANDGRDANPPFNPPPPGPGVWEQNPGNPPPLVQGLRLPVITPLALESASQFRPDGPNDLTSEEYTQNFNQIKELGRDTSATRTPEQTAQALFWTDHDLRQWNDGLLNLATAQGLDLVQTARMLAMAHVAGSDGYIACFDAKYHYWFWRPLTAIRRADADGNPATEADPTWTPLRTTPNHPEYPSAHASHSAAIARALEAFFGTHRIPFSLDSRTPGASPPRTYRSFRDIVKDVNEARVLVGFHFRNSDQEGSNLGRTIGRYVAEHYFQPVQ